MASELIYGVSDFVAYLNQTLEIAYPYVTIEGELSNLRISKNKWVYFDLKDEASSVKFFGTVYSLPGPLEDGMVVRVNGNPRLHNLYGFSVNVQTIVPVGEGALRRAADLLAAKLQAEGLFDLERKRALPYPPARIALVTAAGSAAYVDFMKILNARWRGVTVDHYDVQVQGEPAVGQIVAAIAAVNAAAEVPDVLVLTRGGGSADDLAAFSSEQVTRAVAGSRVPTLVAIGHEVDVSLAELAADQRASTPSNAAELLTPDRADVLRQLKSVRADLGDSLIRLVADRKAWLSQQRTELHRGLQSSYQSAAFWLQATKQLLEAYNPTAALQRGYALVRVGGVLVKRIGQLQVGNALTITLSDGSVEATITATKEQKHGEKG
ncbi:MAG TPA: exodeoxyribonuclease VII large subunit [Candidatus Saccharimonadales bacterium]|nr:exodeoxyribonuclease VII large subunit [Candidatus Saccharimonadales bacterium]